MKRLICSAALALLMTFCFASGPALAQDVGEKKTKIGVSVPLARHGWTGAVIWWAKDEIAKLGRKYQDVEFIFVTADSPDKQVTDLQELMRQEVEAIVVLPVSDTPLAATLAEAHKKGIFIVAVDRISPDLARDVLVTADNPQLGRMSGEIVAQALGGQGKIVIMEALSSSINTMRVDGFKEVIAKYPGISILDSQHVNWNPVTGLEVMEKFLNDHPHLDAIWTGDDSVLIRVLQVYKASGRKDLKLILGLGGAKEVVKMIMDNNPLVQATINYPASIISDSIRVAVEHVVDGQEFAPEIAIICDLVNQGNAKEFYNPDSLY